MRNFIDTYEFPFTSTSVSFAGTGSAEVRYEGNKTDPEVQVYGVNENYLDNTGTLVDQGRNFTVFDIQNNTKVCLIGPDFLKSLFENENPLNKTISIRGVKFKIIGILESKGATFGNNQDLKVLLPLILDLNLNELKKAGKIDKNIRVILHLNDGSKKSLTQKDSSHEFIMSDLLTSLLITQLTDNPFLAGIFDELFQEKGAKICINPLSKFVSISSSTFEVWQIISHINKNNHSFIGLTKNEELILNPNKRMIINYDDKISIITIV